jgi:hypothetical protein
MNIAQQSKVIKNKAGRLRLAEHPPMVNMFTCEISRPGVESEIQDMKQA